MTSKTVLQSALAQWEALENVTEAAQHGVGFLLWVEDTGEGIRPEDLPDLFRRFRRGSGETAGEGSGLGLAIARQLVLAHGGRIGVSSELGRGSSFVVFLPAG